MAKKRGRKTTTSKSSRSSRSRPQTYKRKFSLAWKNFLFFALTTIVFFVLYKVLTNVLLQNFFWFLALIFGCVAAALFIAVIVLAILKKR